MATVSGQLLRMECDSGRVHEFWLIGITKESSIVISYRFVEPFSEFCAKHRLEWKNGLLIVDLKCLVSDLDE